MLLSIVPRSHRLRAALILALAVIVAVSSARDAAPPAEAQADNVIVSRNLRNGVWATAYFDARSLGPYDTGYVDINFSPDSNIAGLYITMYRGGPSGYPQFKVWGWGDFPRADVSGNVNSGLTVRTDTSTIPNWSVGGMACSGVPTKCRPYVDPAGGPRGLIDVTWARQQLQPHFPYGGRESYIGTSGSSWGPFSFTRNSGTLTYIYGAAASGSALGGPIWSGGGDMYFGNGVTLTLSQQ